MVKFYSNSYTYDYPFPAVTLAYFLRYPNPYSTHVLSTDTISRSFNPETQQLTTVRLHLKRSKLPSAVLRILPRSFLGAGENGDTQSYILEKSIVDVRNGRMESECRNLEFTGVLSVMERQVYERPKVLEEFQGIEGAKRRNGLLTLGGGKVEDNAEKTEVRAMVTLHSHLGQGKWKRKKAADESSSEEDEQPKMGFFKSWTTSSLQKSIEVIGLKRARRSQPNAMEGMKVVLERMREGGLVAVLEGMRKDRELVLANVAGAGASKHEDDE